MGETQRFATALAQRLVAGDVVCLYGQLGAGKTYFTKGLVGGLGGAADEVTSPTFVLMQTYEARLTVYHFDAYRLTDSAQMRDIGSDETFYDDGLSVVEWADRVPEALPPERYDVRLTVRGETSRLIEIAGLGPRQAETVAFLAAKGLFQAPKPAL
ncbi:MAG: tRNA (adenosine(37)-N6)-threonylcarbamoyltransferase complex ATPase subunit type 1 TsaE [Planctomycetes bacterium]|nr:tRNA (adenosine(37)-N6)-threonylcarbamoyltransferase complex ATPase subunit type 1 TsaE [Planctomycetota bacterium]